MTPQAFVLRIPDAAIADLKTRLSLTRFPDAAPGEPWAYGTSVEYIRELLSYWKDSFDWRAQEAALNESRSSKCHCKTSICIFCTLAVLVRTHTHSCSCTAGRAQSLNS